MARNKKYFIAILLKNIKIGSMKVFFAIIVIAIATANCKSDKTMKEHFPDHKYHYVVNYTSRSAVQKFIYVPVYSDIYFQSAAKKNILLQH